MFCGWGHLRGCVCEICKHLWSKSTRYEQSRKTIMKVEMERRLVDDMLRRPLPGERSGPKEAVFNDADFFATYPQTAAQLRQMTYDDGSQRVTSTLLVFCDQQVLRVCLNDRDNNRSVFFTGETLEAALLAMENALASNTVEWRTRGQQGFNNTKTPF